MTANWIPSAKYIFGQPAVFVQFFSFHTKKDGESAMQDEVSGFTDLLKN